MSDIDYKQKYLKYKKKYLDLKSNIDQTSGANSKQKVMTFTLDYGEFFNRNDIDRLLDSMSLDVIDGGYQKKFEDLYDKERNGKPIKYDLNIIGNMGSYIFTVTFYNKGDMFKKDEYYITDFYWEDLNPTTKTTTMGSREWDPAKMNNPDNRMKLDILNKDGQLEHICLLSLDKIKGKADKKEKVVKFAKQKLKEKAKDYEWGILNHFDLW